MRLKLGRKCKATSSPVFLCKTLAAVRGVWATGKRIPGIRCTHASHLEAGCKDMVLPDVLNQQHNGVIGSKSSVANQVKPSNEDVEQKYWGPVVCCQPLGNLDRALVTACLGSAGKHSLSLCSGQKPLMLDTAIVRKRETHLCKYHQSDVSRNDATKPMAMSHAGNCNPHDASTCGFMEST